jgi:hypothetical protein
MDRQILTAIVVEVTLMMMNCIVEWIACNRRLSDAPAATRRAANLRSARRRIQRNDPIQRKTGQSQRIVACCREFDQGKHQVMMARIRAK